MNTSALRIMRVSMSREQKPVTVAEYRARLRSRPDALASVSQDDMEASQAGFFQVPERSGSPSRPWFPGAIFG